MARDLLQYTLDSACRARRDLGGSAAVVAEPLKLSRLAAAVEKSRPADLATLIQFQAVHTYFIRTALLLYCRAL